MAANRLKVFTGKIVVKRTEYEAIVATSSQPKVAKLINSSLYHVQMYWTQSFNEEQLKAAFAKPQQVLLKTSKGVYEPYSDVADR